MGGEEALEPALISKRLGRELEDGETYSNLASFCIALQRNSASIADRMTFFLGMSHLSLAGLFAFGDAHHHTPIALQPAEQVVGGEVVVCV